ncbi:MAG: NAD(P)-binding protein [Chloroflexi bacterium]|nr:NAD(P)-binding protein [Chloroflexota bacterium]
MNDKVEIILYGAHWCPDCRRSKQFLGENQIPYKWINIELDEAAEQFVIEKNDGIRSIPTIVFPDGTFLVEPSNAELAEKLGLRTKAERSHYRLIIIGAGPAGLTAAVYTAREGIDTLVIERAAIGGQAAATQWLDNVPGYAEGISGSDYADQMRLQAKRFDVEILQASNVVEISRSNNYPCVVSADGKEYSAQAVLLATGSRYKRLEIPGESDFIGAGIHFCATCDGPFYKGKHVGVIGGGNSAAEESVFLLNFVDRITMLVRGDELKASKILVDKVSSLKKIDVQFNNEAIEFFGAGGKLTSIRTKNNKTGTEGEIEPAAVFIFIGQIPNSDVLGDIGIHTNQWGFVTTGHDLVHIDNALPSFDGREPAALETSIPGIFAAGDVRAGSTKQVASAAGEGATAALLIREYLKTV